MSLPPLYPIVNVTGADEASRERALELAVELAGSGATLLQLRAKTLAAGAFTDLACRMVEALRGSGARLVINDRIDVALASDAAGVHLGDEDVPVTAARRVVDICTSRRAMGANRPAFLIGFSTHSVEEVRFAQFEPASYIGFGPVFDSPTKAGVREARGVEALARACSMSRLPVVAIGGVDLETAPACWKAGAASVAVISEIERSGDRRALVAAYLRAAQNPGPATVPGPVPR